MREITICFDNSQGVIYTFSMLILSTSPLEKKANKAKKNKKKIILSIGILSFGLQRTGVGMEFFPNVFEGITFHEAYETQPLCVYFAGRGKYQAYRFEYYGR